jgi:hypothetical protein
MPRSEGTLPFAARKSFKLAGKCPAPETVFPAAAETLHPHTCNQPGGKPFRKLDRISFPARHRCGPASLCRLRKSGM